MAHYISKGVWRLQGLGKDHKDKMERLWTFLVRVLLNVLFLSVYVDVPLPPPFNGKAGMKVKVPSDWVDFVVGGGSRAQWET